MEASQINDATTGGHVEEPSYYFNENYNNVYHYRYANAGGYHYHHDDREQESHGWWDRFFHSTTGPDGIRLGGMFRIAYSFLVLVNFSLFGRDLQWLLSPTSRHAPYEIGKKTVSPYSWTIFSILPQTETTLWVCYSVAMTQIVLLLLGVCNPRFQALCVWLWQWNFHSSNNLIWDGEDSVFRLLGFFLVFFPLHRYTLTELLRGRRSSYFPTQTPQHLQQQQAYEEEEEEEQWPMWPFRLAQLEMALIYASTGILKAGGSDWQNGVAMYGVVHLDDVYGLWYNPDFLFCVYGVTWIMTYLAVIVELLAPILLWWKPTRMPMLTTVIGFHIGMAFAMNLNCFQYIMIVG